MKHDDMNHLSERITSDINDIYTRVDELLSTKSTLKSPPPYET